LGVGARVGAGVGLGVKVGRVIRVKVWVSRLPRGGLSPQQASEREPLDLAVVAPG